MVTIKKGRSSEELRWQAESDADAMATYQEIMGDKRENEQSHESGKGKSSRPDKESKCDAECGKDKEFIKKKVRVWEQLRKK